MTKILLTHSFLLLYDPKQWNLGHAYAPLGTLYAASLLRDHHFEFHFFDTTFVRDPDEIVPVLKKHEPDLLIIYEDGFNYLTKMCLTNMREASFRMISHAKKQQSKVIVCSSDASDNWQLYLETGADYCIIGEGEKTLLELLKRIDNQSSQDFSHIKGIAWKSHEGARINPARENITNLDDIPLLAWDLVNIEEYRNFWLRRDGQFTLNMVTTRGCPFHCSWCAKPIYGNNYNSRSPQNVVSEMILLKEKFSPDSIWFADDIFALKPRWIEEFSRLVNSNNVVIPYIIQSRVDLILDNRQVRFLAESGCMKIWLGIESGSQKILDAMNKGIAIEQVYTASLQIRKNGIEQAFFLQLGYPGENKDDIRNTMKLLTDLMPDDIGISISYPLPGTKFYESVKNDLMDKANWTDSDELALMFRNNFSPGYYRILHRYIHKYYRFRQGLFYLKNKNINRKAIRRIFLLPYYLLFAIVLKILLKLKDSSD